MIDDALDALVSAWRVTLAALVLLFTALAVAPIWDGAIYLKALHEALAMDHL